VLYKIIRLINSENLINFFKNNNNHLCYIISNAQVLIEIILIFSPTSKFIDLINKFFYFFNMK
jgi:hypothetical protein